MLSGVIMRSGRFIFLSFLLTAWTSTHQVSALSLSGSGNLKSDFISPAMVILQENNPPSITGQNPDPVEISEDQSFEITFDHLIVTDTDNIYPQGFTLSIGAGDNYTVSGNSVIPAPDYSGTLSVPVMVNDGVANSNIYSFQISVAAVNDTPVITGQTPDPLSTPEEQAITIELTHLVVTDPDNTFPGTFTLQVSEGTNYTVSGNTVMPALNFNGMLSVPVTVSDGETVSNIFDVHIEVTPVNDPPVITAQVPDPLSTQEDVSITIRADNLVVSDPDNTYPTGFSLSVGDGDNYTVSSTTITPAADFTGMLSVPVTVNDGLANSNTFILEINVIGSNDPPVITGQTPVSVDEDNSISILYSHLQVTDDDNAYPTGFSITVANGENYTVSGTTVTPSLNFSGVLTVPVTVSDGTNDSEPFNFQITVNPVNDPPVITAQTPLTINENQSIVVALSNLSVTDPDNTYPSGFTLQLESGSNYTVSGTTVTPSAGFSGVLTVGVSVNDGAASSAVFPLQITVNPVNDPPVITGHRALSTLEDTPITLLLSDITVTDLDNIYPSGFILKVLPGANYLSSGNTITPSANFNGILTVNVSVNDGTTDSAPFGIQITVVAVNDAPVITGQQSLSVNEDQAIALGLTHFQVSDPDNTYPTGFTLSVFNGENYTVSGTSVIPATGFSGTLTVPVQVNDGVANSNIFQAQITILPVNNAPVITGQQVVSTPEDVPVTIQLSHLTVFDSDNTFPSGFTLTIHPGTNYSVSGTTITPATDFTGTLNVTITVSDGTSQSAPFVFQIQVGDANDPPVIVGQTPLSTNEDQAVTIALTHVVVNDPDNTFPNGFTLEVSAGANFTVSGNTVTPAVNFTGVLTVPVRVNDGVNNSPPFDFKITVNPVNDPPTFDAIANQVINENSPEQKVLITGISAGPGETDQIVTLSATSSNSSIIPDPVITYSPSQTTATLTYSPVPNASGMVSITVIASDNGASTPPHLNTYNTVFQVEVTEVNNAPTLDPVSDLTIDEDAPEILISLTGISAGAGETQQLSVTAETDKPGLFEIFNVLYTHPQPNGVLQIKPAANASGIAKINVTVVDGGSSVAPSVNSITRTFTLTIQPVNDPPVFVSSPVSLAVVNEPYEYIVEISDVENDALGIQAISKPDWLSLTSTGGGKAKLSGTPGGGSAGTFTVTLRVDDAGNIVEQTYSLVVNTRPVVESFNVSMEEDQVLSLQVSHFEGAYSDADAHSLAAIVITQKPVVGNLFIGDRQINNNDTIQSEALASLVYIPALNYFGQDGFYWKASDGYHLSLNPALAEIQIAPVNDAPIIVLSRDTMQYEVNGEPAFLDELLTVEDPDDDSLAQAEIIFDPVNLNIEFDRLVFGNLGNIRASYDFETGRLLLTGPATLEDFQQALRSIQYTHINTVDPALESKRISFLANDGSAQGDPAAMIIDLRYNFIELEIPSGFTPNGDNANDTWSIQRPGGIDQLTEAEIRVFTSRGVKVFEARGFDQSWDGTYQGELLPAGTYFYTIDLKLRSKKTYRGVVTILR